MPVADLDWPADLFADAIVDDEPAMPSAVAAIDPRILPPLWPAIQRLWSDGISSIELAATA